MMNQIKANLKGIVKGDLEIVLNKVDKVVIIKSNVILSVMEKQMINKQIKKVSSSLVVFFR